jgi:hypothetical protein
MRATGTSSEPCLFNIDNSMGLLFFVDILDVRLGGGLKLFFFFHVGEKISTLKLATTTTSVGYRVLSERFVPIYVPLACGLNLTLASFVRSCIRTADFLLGCVEHVLGGSCSSDSGSYSQLYRHSSTEREEERSQGTYDCSTLV